MSCEDHDGVIVTYADEIEKPRGVDLRTRAGREAEVLAQVDAFGGFSIGWVTELQARAQAADRLLKRRTIVRDRDQHGGFPWCPMRRRSKGKGR